MKAEQEFEGWTSGCPDLEAVIHAGHLTDTSWHNDAAPSFEAYGENRKTGYRLWIDHKDNELREMCGGGPRCLIVPLEHLGVEEESHRWQPKEDAKPVLTTESVQEAVDWMLRFKMGVCEGDRVRFKTQYDIFPMTVVPVGATGTVTAVYPERVEVKLDAYDPELDEWGNNAHIDIDNRLIDEDEAQFVLCYLEPLV